MDCGLSFDSFPRPFQWHHSRADLIWQNGLFNIFVLLLYYSTLSLGEGLIHGVRRLVDHFFASWLTNHRKVHHPITTASCNSLTSSSQPLHLAAMNLIQNQLLRVPWTMRPLDNASFGR
jgi:hypothetical protein